MARAQHNIKRVILGGMLIDALTQQECADLMVADWRAVKEAGDNKPLPKIVLDANGHALSHYWKFPAFRSLMDEADYIIADGQPLVIASRVVTLTQLPERLALTDFGYVLAEKAMQNGMNVFFLGSTEEINKITAERMQVLYPQLNIVGRRNGYFTEAEEKSIIADILEKKTDLLFVALGRPKQEEFAFRNREALRGVTWIKPVGGFYDFVAGRVKRAPQWMQDSGLEWLYRLIQEPRRLFHRYLTTNLHAAYLLLTRSKDVNDDIS